MKGPILSKVTKRGRTTLPKPIREALGLAPGDTLLYRIEGPAVAIAKDASGTDTPFALFSEWAGEADSQAYSEL